jgi:hypothetical protein
MIKGICLIIGIFGNFSKNLAAGKIGDLGYLIATRNPATMIRAKRTGIRQPMSAPILRCRPDLVRGIPIFRLSLALAAEMPKARFQEKPPLFMVVGYILRY